MQFTVDREAFVKVMGIVSRAIPSKTALEILHGFHLKAGDGEVTLRAYDGELSLQMTVPALVIETGEVVIRAKLLQDWCRSAQDSQLLVKADKQLELVSGRAKAKFACQPAEEFPPEPSVKGEPVMISADEVRTVLPRVVISSSVSQDMPVLTGVHFQFQESEQVVLSAADGYRMSVEELSLRSKPAQANDVVVLRQVLLELLRIVGESDTVEFVVGENSVKFLVGQVELIGRRVQGQFPDCLKLVPENFKESLMVDSGELAKAVRLISPLARDGYGLVRLQFKGEELVVSGSSEGDSAEYGLAVLDHQAKEFKIALRVQYLAEVLAGGQGPVSFHWNGPSSALLVGFQQALGFVHIIMPMHAQWE